MTADLLVVVVVVAAAAAKPSVGVHLQPRSQAQPGFRTLLHLPVVHQRCQTPHGGKPVARRPMVESQWFDAP